MGETWEEHKKKRAAQQQTQDTPASKMSWDEYKKKRDESRMHSPLYNIHATSYDDYLRQKNELTKPNLQEATSPAVQRIATPETAAPVNDDSNRKAAEFSRLSAEYHLPEEDMMAEYNRLMGIDLGKAKKDIADLRTQREQTLGNAQDAYHFNTTNVTDGQLTSDEEIANGQKATEGYAQQGNDIDKTISQKEGEYRQARAVQYGKKTVPELDALLKTAKANGDDEDVMALKQARLQQYESKTAPELDALMTYAQASGDAENIQAIKDAKYTVDLKDKKLELERVKDAPDFQAVARSAKSPDLSNEANTIIYALSNAKAGYGTEYDKWHYASNDEKNVLRYYYAAGDMDKFNQYKDAINRDLEQRWVSQGWNKTKKQLDETGPAGKVAAGVMSIGTNLQAPIAYVENLFQAAKNTATGKYEPTDQNSAAQATTGITGQLRDYTMQGADDFMKFLGNTGYSIVDMAATLPFGPAGSLGIMSAEAAGQATNNALQRGATPDQAAAEGTIYGAIEYVTEKLPIENLFTLARPVKNAAGETVKRSIGQSVKEVLKQAGIEGSEEWISQIADNLTDMAVMGNKSQIAQNIQQSMAQGMSKADAERQAGIQAFIIDPVVAFAGGAAAGGVLGAGGTVIGNTRLSKMAKEPPLNQQTPVAPSKETIVTGQGNTTTAPLKTDNGPVATALKSNVDEVTPLPASRETLIPARSNADNNPVGVKGIHSVENGKVMLELAGGKTTSLDRISFDDPAMDRLYDYASTLDTKTAKNFIYNYKDSISPDAYYSGFLSIYKEARKGTPMEEAISNSLHGKGLNLVQQQAAYFAGENSLKEAAQSFQLPEKPAQPAQPDAVGVVRKYKGNLTQAQEHMIDAMDKIFNGIGRKVVVEDTITYKDVTGRERKSDTNAYFNPETNEYHIALNAVGHAYVHYAVHESVHDIAANNQGGYKQLEQTVFDILKQKNEDVSKLLDIQKEFYPKKNETYWREEVLANTVPVILTDEKFGAEFARQVAGMDKESRTVFQKIIDAIRSFLTKAYNILKEQKGWEQMKSIEGDIEAVNRIRDTYLSALKEIKNPERENGIRFSLKDTSAVSINYLQKENEKLQRALDLVKTQFKLTQGHHITEKAITQLARGILKETSSSYDLATLQDNLRTLFDYIANTRAPVWEEIEEMGVGMAKSILEASSVMDTGTYDYYTEARDYLKNTPIKLTSVQRSEAEYAFDTYREYRNTLFGSVKLTNDGISLDRAWQELSARYPELFDPAAGEADMPLILADAVESMKPQYNNPYGYSMDEAAYDLFLQVYDKYFELPEVQTFADKRKAKLQQVKTQYDSMIENIREDAKLKYTANLQKLKADNAARKQELTRKYSKALEKNNAVAAEKLQAQRAKLVGDMNNKLLEQKAKFKQWKIEDRVNRSKRLYQMRIEKSAGTLMTWLTRPTDKQHVPADLQKIVSGFITSLDFTGDKYTKKATAWNLRMMELRAWMQKAETQNVSENGTFFIDTDPDFLQELDDFIGLNKNVNSVKDLSAEQLQRLDKILGILMHTVTGANKMHANELYEEAAAAGEASMSELQAMKAARPHGPKGTMIGNLLNVAQLDSFSYFDQLGDSAKSILSSLRRGFDAKVDKIGQTVEFMKDLLKGENIRKWSGLNADIRTFKFPGGELRLTTGQIMELYLLSKRPQAQGHIYGKGIKPVDVSVKMNGKVRYIRHGNPVRVTEDEVDTIIKSLAPEQRAMADAMQDFVSTQVSGWGNDASREMYGYEKFTESHYWPIRSDENYTNTQDPGIRAALYAVRNLGMAKPLVEGANNPLVLSDIFDTFIKHVNDMSNYAAFLSPLSDAMKWFNYRSEDGSVKQAIERVLGAQGKLYFVNLMKDINGMPEREYSPGISEALLRAMKTASVAANISVVIQQPTSYLRAASMLSPKYMAAAVFHKKNIELVKKYVPIARWKSWGFFDVNLGKSLRELMIHDSSVLQKAREYSLAPAQWADNLTWATLWSAVEMEIKAAQPKLAPGTEEYYQAVGARLSEVIDRTQVVDSVFHRSQLMRSKNPFVQMTTAFMSEPTKYYNMIRNAIMAVAQKKPDAGKMLARTAFAAFAAMAVNGAARSIIQALRSSGDDDDKDGKANTFGENYLKALFGFKGDWKDVAGSNLLEGVNPLTYIPYLRDIWSTVKGYDVKRFDMQGISALVSSGGAWIDAALGNSKASTYKLIYDSANALSTLTGVPLYNLLREFNSIYNTAVKKPIDMQSETASAEKSYQTLYDAILAGDKAKIADIRKILATYKEGPKSPGEIDVGIAGELMKKDARIAQAYAARKAVNTAELRRIRNEIIAAGFSGEVVDKAINLYETAGKDYMAIYDAILAKDPQKAQQLQSALLSNKYRKLKQEDVDKGIATVLTQKDPRITEAYDALSTKNMARYQDIRSKIIAAGFDSKIVDLAIDTYVKNKKKELDAPLFKNDDLFTAIRAAVSSGNYSSIDDIYKELLKDSEAKDPAQAIKNQVTGEFKKDFISYMTSGEAERAKSLGNVLKDKFGYSDDDLQGWVITEQSRKMKAALTSGDIDTANDYITEQQDLGQADSAIKSGVTNLIKPKIIELYKADDYDGIADIANNLGQLGLYTKKGNSYYNYDFVWSWIDEYLQKGEEAAAEPTNWIDDYMKAKTAE